MEALETLLSDLDKAIKTKSKKARAEIFGKVVQLYFASIDLQFDDHVEFFADVFGLLVDHVDADELADLGRRIAAVERAPAKLIRRLANDDQIDVAGPVIEQSPHLTSDDLVMLAWTKSQEHLAAIGSRTRVDAAVTSVLVERADGEVIRKIAKNDGAEFSTDGFAKLAQRAIHDDELAEVVGTRADIPTEVLHAMMTQVEAAVQSRILAAAHPHMKGEVESAITAASHSPHDYSAARQRVIELQQAGQLAERELIHLIQSGRIDEALVALELMSSTPVEVIERFLWGAAAETMPVVCKAAGLSWMAAEATLALASAVGQPLSEGAKRKALAAYSKLTRATAEKLLRFWFVRGSNRAGRRPREGHDIAAARRKGQKPA